MNKTSLLILIVATFMTAFSAWAADAPEIGGTIRAIPADAELGTSHISRRGAPFVRDTQLQELKEILDDLADGDRAIFVQGIVQFLVSNRLGLNFRRGKVMTFEEEIEELFGITKLEIAQAIVDSVPFAQQNYRDFGRYLFQSILFDYSLETILSSFLPAEYEENPKTLFIIEALLHGLGRNKEALLHVLRLTGTLDAVLEELKIDNSDEFVAQIEDFKFIFLCTKNPWLHYFFLVRLNLFTEFPAIPRECFFPETEAPFSRSLAESVYEKYKEYRKNFFREQARETTELRLTARPRLWPFHPLDRDRNHVISLDELLDAFQPYHADTSPLIHAQKEAHYCFHAPVPGPYLIPPYLPREDKLRWQHHLVALYQVLELSAAGGYKPASWNSVGFRPGAPLGSDENWHGHVQDFLDSIYEDESIETFDRNEVGYAHGGDVLHLPNGIPDAAEFAVLQFVLHKDHVRWPSHRGISPGVAHYAWDWNYEQAKLDLGEELVHLPGWAFVIASYITIGDFGSIRLIRELRSAHLAYQTIQTQVDYRILLSQYLQYKTAATNDLYWNIDTWQHMQPASPAEWEDYAAATTGYTENPLALVVKP